MSGPQQPGQQRIDQIAERFGLHRGLPDVRTEQQAVTEARQRADAFSTVLGPLAAPLAAAFTAAARDEF